MFGDKKNDNDLFGFFSTINSLFGDDFPFVYLGFDKEDDKESCNEDSLQTIRYDEGLSTYDAFKNGKHVKHVVKKLEDGKWVPVEGKCCSLNKEEENKPIGVNEPDVKPFGPCKIKQAEKDSSVMEEITRLEDANKKLKEENAMLKRELASAASEMTKFKNLMEEISYSFKKFNRKDN